MGRKLDAEIVLMHVLESASASAEQNESAMDRLNDFAKGMPDGVRWLKSVRAGNPAHEVLAAIEREAIDFVAMPTRGLAPLEAFLFGSVTEKVLHKAQCPVWTEGKESEGVAVHEDILCCVDLGPSSAEVLEWAGLLATKLGAKLKLMHVGHGDAALVELRHLAERVGVTAECMVRSGEVAATILDEVEVRGADLLVMGRGEERSFTGRFRSHAQAVIQKSHCAVFSV